MSKKYSQLATENTVTLNGMSEKAFFPITGHEKETLITRDGDMFTVVDAVAGLVREIPVSQVRWAEPADSAEILAAAFAADIAGPKPKK